MGLRKEFLYVFFFSFVLVSSLFMCGVLLDDSGVVEDGKEFYSSVVVSQRLDECFIPLLVNESLGEDMIPLGINITSLSFFV